MKERFFPHVTVAAVIEQNQQFLLVEEKVEGGIFFNQPAGHLEKNESLIAAVSREVLEETAFDFTPTFLIGIYQFMNPQTQLHFLRFCFGGILGKFYENKKLDENIIQTHWVNFQRLKTLPLRSKMVLSAIEDYQNKKRFPLTLFNDFISK